MEHFDMKMRKVNLSECNIHQMLHGKKCYSRDKRGASIMRYSLTEWSIQSKCRSVYKSKHLSLNTPTNRGDKEKKRYRNRNISLKTLDAFFLGEKSPMFRHKQSGLDNRMNLIFSQTKEHFVEQFRKRYPVKAELNKIAESGLQGQINGIKKKVCFMKNVVDFSYPLLIKNNSLKEQVRRTYKKRKIRMNDCEDVLNNRMKLQKENEKYYTQSITVKKMQMSI